MENLEEAHIWQKFSMMLSSKFGVVRRLRYDDKILLPSGLVSLSGITADSKQLGNYFGNSAGTGMNPSAAKLSTVGEALERYSCAMAVNTLNATEVISRNEIRRANSLSPNELRYFAPEQFCSPDFKCVEFTDDLRLRWMSGFDHRDQTAVLVPDFAVTGGSKGSPQVFFNTSSGLGLGASPDAAFRSGLLEVVERDAFMGVWLNKISPPRIRLESIADASSKLMIESLSRSGFELHILDALTDFGIPVVFAALRSEESRRPAFLMAGAAHGSYEVAIRKALMELIQVLLYYVGTVKNSMKLKRYSGDWIDDITGFHDGFELHARSGSRSMNAFLTAGKQIDCPAGLNAPENTLQLIQSIVKRGYRVVGVDVTSSDLAQLGISIFRAVIPGSIPITFSYRYRPLGVARVYEFKKRIGLAKDNLPKSKINSFPHPFP